MTTLIALQCVEANCLLHSLGIDGGTIGGFGFLEREDIWFEIETEKTIDWGRDCLMNG